MSAATSRSSVLHRIQPKPRYELRAIVHGNGEMEVQVWQMPSVATPRLALPEWTASIKGRPLRMIEHRLIKRLKAEGFSIAGLRRGQQKRKDIDEELAMSLALTFRTLAPMKSIERIEQVSLAIDKMGQEEASYWFGMALHRKNPRRVFAALRTLLTSM